MSFNFELILNFVITDLRQIGHRSLKKTMSTLILLGNLLFGKNLDLSNDANKSRQQAINTD